jgi:acetyltransferase-like isoleucine patch superfamily enzyme/acyl carrier protein
VTAEQNKSRQTLDESQFIRSRLHGTSESLWRKYASLVLARPSLPSLIRYELVGWLGMLPGAIGLGIRRIAFRSLIADAGAGTLFGRGITLRHADNMHLGSSVTLDDYCLLDARGAGPAGLSLGDRVIVNRNASVQAKAGAIAIGNDTSIGAYAHIISQGPIDIGENVSIAGGTMIAGGRYEVDLAPDDSSKSRFTGGAIVIESNVRIGMGSIILDGVRIGRNAIVAPGSVVFDDVPAGIVVIGCPARPLRKRPGSAEPVEPRARAPQPGGPSAAGPSRAASPREDTVTGAIRDYLAQTHGARFGPGNLSDTDSLFESRVIDSVGLVGLITMMEEQFRIELSEDDLVPENLDTVKGLAAVVRSKLQ